MTPGARITSALLLAVVVVSLGYLFTYEIAGPDVYLLSGGMFSAHELNNMESAFGQEGLKSYEIEGNKVRIPRGQQSEYMAALTKHNALPEQFGDFFTRALDAGSAFMSSRERDARLKVAKEKELSRIISKIDGIEWGTVLYDSKKQGGLRRDTMITASVHVKPSGSRELAPQLAESIRILVCSSIAGLELKDVAVTDVNSGYATRGNSENYSGPHNDEYIAKQKHHEEKYKQTVLESLGYIPGVTVATHVELNEEKKHEEEAVTYDSKKSVPIQQSEKSFTDTSESNPPAGPPGFLAQGSSNTPRRLTAAGTTSSTQEREESETSTFSAPSSQTVRTEKAGLTPKRVTVAVTLPTSYYEDLWRKQNPTQEGEEPKEPGPADLDPIRQVEIVKIKETVAAILPSPEDGSDPKDLVTVTDFRKPILPPVPEAGLASNALSWLGESWATLGIIALVFFSLLMLRSMIQAAPTSEAEFRLTSARSSETGADEDESEEEGSNRKLRRFGSTGASLKDELSDLVAEDPDSAANILRNWIGNVT
jgi:flagellar M-ring protein FliF